MQNWQRKGQSSLFDFVENLNTPVIAAVNGFALGGGLRIGDGLCISELLPDNAKMGLPEVSLGVIPGYGGTQRLPQLVGKGKAMELIMTAGMLTAEEAKASGLVNHIVPQSELLELANSIAQKIMKNSPVAIGKAIEAINANFKDGIDGYAVRNQKLWRSFWNRRF